MKIRYAMMSFIVLALAVFSFAQMESMNYYRISPEKVDSLAALKPEKAEILKKMTGIDFPDTMLVHRYALKLMATALNVCDENSNVEKNSLKIDTNYFVADSSSVLRNVFLDLISTKKSSCTDEIWVDRHKKIDVLYREYLAPEVNAMLESVNEFKDESMVLPTQKSCGCSHNEELNAEVFGIYPYWYVGDSTKWIDFEGVTRLEFYGLYADINGTLRMPSGTIALNYFDDEKNYEFVNEAHRHFVKLDWIIKKDDWTNINQADFFNKLADEIEALLKKKVNSTFQRIVNTLSFYTDDFEYRGDGVTILFKNYPKDAESTKNFGEFFKKLNRKLSKVNKHVFVNVMMDRLDLVKKDEPVNSTESKNGNGIYSYDYFASIANFPDNQKKINRKQFRKELKNYLFVVVEEPVSRSKRFVLNDLDQQLNDKERHNVLHSVVPVLWFDFKQWNQLNNDALYYNDTYFGFGIAPYVTDEKAKNACLDMGNLGMCMIEHLENEDGKNERQGSIGAFVCTHRWVFRLFNILAFLIAVGLIIGYFVSCSIADFFNNRLALLLAIVVLPSTFMMVIVMLFDPTVFAFNGLLGMLPICILLLATISIILLQARQKNDVPTRQKE